MEAGFPGRLGLGMGCCGVLIARARSAPFPVAVPGRGDHGVGVECRFLAVAVLRVVVGGLPRGWLGVRGSPRLLTRAPMKWGGFGGGVGGSCCGGSGAAARHP